MLASLITGVLSKGAYAALRELFNDSAPDDADAYAKRFFQVLHKTYSSYFRQYPESLPQPALSCLHRKENYDLVFQIVKTLGSQISPSMFNPDNFDGTRANTTQLQAFVDLLKTNIMEDDMLARRSAEIDHQNETDAIAADLGQHKRESEEHFEVLLARLDEILGRLPQKNRALVATMQTRLGLSQLELDGSRSRSLDLLGLRLLVAKGCEQAGSHDLILIKEGEYKYFGPYLSEACQSLSTQFPSIALSLMNNYSTVRLRLGISQQDDLRNAIVYEEWVQRSHTFLRDVQTSFRFVTYDEWAGLWDKPISYTYLALSLALKKVRGADLRRIFVFENSYFADEYFLRRLIREILVQNECGIEAKVMELEELRHISRGYAYSESVPALGIYDDRELHFLLPHPTMPVVNRIREEGDVMKAIELYDELFEVGNDGYVWASKRRRWLSQREEQKIAQQLAAIQREFKALVI